MGKSPLNVNDLVQIKLAEDEAGSAYPSRVDDIAGDTLILAWPTQAGAPIPLRAGQRLVLYFLRKDAVYACTATVNETRQEPVPRIAVGQSGEVQRIQRRAYFRVRAPLPVQLTGVVHTAKSESPEGKTVHIVTSTVDISGAGLSIHYSSPLPVNTVFEMKLGVEDGDEPLKLLGRVVHYQPVAGLEDGRQVYRVAFFFLAITEGQRRRIVRRCFRFQQESLLNAGPSDAGPSPA